MPQQAGTELESAREAASGQNCCGSSRSKLLQLATTTLVATDPVKDWSCVLPSHFGGSASFRVARFVGKDRLRSHEKSGHIQMKGKQYVFKQLKVNGMVWYVYFKLGLS